MDYKYKKLPSPMALRRYHKELVKWHRLNGSPAGTEDRDFEDYLNDRLSDATHRNSMNNINRGNYVFRSTLAIAVSVVALLFAAAPFLIQGIGAEESPTLIEVVGEVSVNQGED